LFILAYCTLNYRSDFSNRKTSPQRTTAELDYAKRKTHAVHLPASACGQVEGQWREIRMGNRNTEDVGIKAMEVRMDALIFVSSFIIDRIDDWQPGIIFCRY
jgi:hypothetical protein